MTLTQRIEIFSNWGEYLRNNTDVFLKLSDNPWFTKENVKNAIMQLAVHLTKEELHQWLDKYAGTIEKSAKNQRAMVLSAGNIPAVGFHDFLSVLITGNIYVGKLSSDDNVLLPEMIKSLLQIAPQFSGFIRFTDKIEGNCDKFIATGSNNSARYFDYYFKNKPALIRRNRNSCAVLDGNETEEQLEKLAEDVFLYFGMGCRSVSKLFVPENYDFSRLFDVFSKSKNIIDNQEYLKNYIYQKAVFTINNINFFDRDFYLLKEDRAYASPVSVLYYEYYHDLEMLQHKLTADKELLQCIVYKNTFGAAQQPGWSDYSDGIDTIAWLINGK